MGFRVYGVYGVHGGGLWLLRHAYHSFRLLKDASAKFSTSVRDRGVPGHEKLELKKGRDWISGRILENFKAITCVVFDYLYSWCIDSLFLA